MRPVKIDRHCPKLFRTHRSTVAVVSQCPKQSAISNVSEDSPESSS